MVSNSRRNHSPRFKVRVALAAIKQEKTLAELTSIYGVHPTQIRRWKEKVIAAAENAFGNKFRRREKDQEELVAELYRQIGQLKVERDFLKKKMGLFE